MIGIDTNILIRYLTNDDETQAATVKKYFNDMQAKHERLFVSLAVTLECIWVLESGYNLDNDSILDALNSLLGLSLLKFEHDDSILNIIHARRKGDLSDQIIGNIGHSSGCSTTMTFDKKAAKLETFELLK
jgi:predicted nucleic-acid-binding protein